MSDPVNNPDYYRTEDGIEAIDVIEAFFPNNYHLGNAFKYLARAGKKDPDKLEEDLEKAIWYIQRFMDTQIRYTLTEKGKAVAEVLAAGFSCPIAKNIAYIATDGKAWLLHDDGLWYSPTHGLPAETKAIIDWMEYYGTEIKEVE